MPFIDHKPIALETIMIIAIIIVLFCLLFFILINHGVFTPNE